MRRVALALLLLASPALAGRVAVIREFTKGSAGESEYAASKRLSAVTSRLDFLGVDYDVITQATIANNALALKTGTVYLSPGPGAVSRQYVAMIHTCFKVGGNRFTGYTPDSLTLGAGWPSIPHIFLGPNSIQGSGFSSTASCSTGISGSATVSGLANSLSMSFTAPGYPYAFHVAPNTGGTINQAYYINSANALTKTSTQAGIFKSRLVMGASSMAFNDNGNSSAAWPDSMGRPTSYSVGADTCAIWTRERYSGDTAPLIFETLLNITNNSATNGDSFIDMAVALADSATRGQIIGQKEGWSPPTIAFVVSGAFTRSVSSGLNYEVSSTHGVQCATQCDTTLIKAGIDSLKSLGIPVTVTVNVDSVASFPYEKSWWSGIPTARFAPECRVGTGTDLTGAARLADRYSSPDLFGYQRTRTLGYGSTCPDGDTSLTCQLKYTRSRLDSIPEFRGRVGRFIQAANSDYLHAGITRANSSGDDSIAAVLRGAGYSCAGIDMMMGDAGMASWWAYSGGNKAPATGAPGSLIVSQRQVRQLNPGLDGFNWLAFRAIDEDNSGSAFTNHPIDAEFWSGTSGTAPWYRSDLSYWRHNFRTRLSLFVVRPGDLGYQSTGNPMRPGYHNIRWLVSQVKLINAFAGRTVIKIGYPEDIKP